MTRQADFFRENKENTERCRRKEIKFWILWSFAFGLLYFLWKPAPWFILVPILRYIMFGNWKQENELINQELGNKKIR
jgi:hypothetical protein